MSDTPRTEREFPQHLRWEGSEIKMRFWAEKLERELAAKDAECKAKNNELVNLECEITFRNSRIGAQDEHIKALGVECKAKVIEALEEALELIESDTQPRACIRALIEKRKGEGK